MMVDSIIDLDDNTHYLLLDETEIENRKFFYAILLTEDCQSPTDKFTFFEEVQKEGELFVQEVEDKQLEDYLITVFTNNYLNSVENI